MDVEEMFRFDMAWGNPPGTMLRDVLEFLIWCLDSDRSE
jgi:hypothetical protein